MIELVLVRHKSGGQVYHPVYPNFPCWWLANKVIAELLIPSKLKLPLSYTQTAIFFILLTICFFHGVDPMCNSYQFEYKLTPR